MLSKIANFTRNGTRGAFMLFHACKGLNEECRTEEDWIRTDVVEVEFSDQMDLEHYQRIVNETIQNLHDQRPEPCRRPGASSIDPDETCCKKIGGNLCCAGSTNITKALNGALTMMFQYSSGMRENAEQVAILITDGQDFKKGEVIDEDHEEYPQLIQKYKEMAKKFKDSKIKILAIGVGDVNEETLNILVQSPEHFIKSVTFDNLVDNLTDLIGSIICKGMQFLS